LIAQELEDRVHVCLAETKLTEKLQERITVLSVAIFSRHYLWPNSFEGTRFRSLAQWGKIDESCLLL